MSSGRLTSAMFSTEGMDRVFSAENTVQRMLDVEAALAHALAAAEVIPPQAVADIVSACHVSQINLDLLERAARDAGNLAIPLVKQLTAKVAEKNTDAARHVHWGATSQDIIDTGMILQLREALNLLTTELAEFADALAAHAHRYRSTPMIGRSWMQHALPITFGLKAAGWLDAILRHQDRLAELHKRVSVLQFGGAAGTLASLGHQGLTVASGLAHALELNLPAMPWHTHRDRIAEAGSTLGLLTGTLGKIARDISLLAQTEIAELSEPVTPGRGGSSTMPHKRNPVACAATLAAATRVPALVGTLLSAMVQENERALGGWQAEWDTFPEIARLSAAALSHMRDVIERLGADTARMRANIDSTQGLVMAEAVSLALGRHIGRGAAHEILEAACALAADSKRTLREIVQADTRIRAVLAADEIDSLFDPAHYLGEAEAFVDRVLDAHRQRKS